MYMLQTLPGQTFARMVVLPGELLHCDAGRKKTLAAIQRCLGDGMAFFCAQRMPEAEPEKKIATVEPRSNQAGVSHQGMANICLYGLDPCASRTVTSEDPYFGRAFTRSQSRLRLAAKGLCADVYLTALLSFQNSRES